MARISYDQPTADAFKAVREVPRGGLREWREAVRRHLQPSPGMTLADIGAGTGAYSAAFSDWFGIDVVAIEPSAAMREQIPRTPRIRVLDGRRRRAAAARRLGRCRLALAGDPPHPRSRGGGRTRSGACFAPALRC